MKLRDGILVTKADNVYYLVDARAGDKRFNGMVKLNATGGFACNLLKVDITLENMISELMKEYNVGYDIAKSDIERLLEKLESIGFLEN